jgi:hypothetical protein
MALDMQKLEFFCSEDCAEDRVRMVFSKRRYALLRFHYLYECPKCGNIARTFWQAGRLHIDPHVERATRRNQRKRAAAA